MHTRMALVWQAGGRTEVPAEQQQQHLHKHVPMAPHCKNSSHTSSSVAWASSPPTQRVASWFLSFLIERDTMDAMMNMLYIGDELRYINEKPDICRSSRSNFR